MGRKKRYDRGELVARATDLFRDHGFAGTSTEMLVEQLEVNRNTMYSEFGSKQALFEASLEHYDRLVVTRNFGPLEAPGAGIAEIRMLLDFFAGSASGPVSGRGCLLCNTAVEFGPSNPGGHEFVERYLNRLSSAFLNALENAKQAGDLDDSVRVGEEANFFTASVLGMFVMLRAKAQPKLVSDVAKVAFQHLASLSSSRA